MSGSLALIMDGLDTTYFKTARASYPWIQVAPRRRYLITKVEVLSGIEPLMNL